MGQCVPIGNNGVSLPAARSSIVSPLSITLFVCLGVSVAVLIVVVLRMNRQRRQAEPLNTNGDLIPPTVPVSPVASAMVTTPPSPDNSTRLDVVRRKRRRRSRQSVNEPTVPLEEISRTNVGVCDVAFVDSISLCLQ